MTNTEHSSGETVRNVPKGQSVDCDVCIAKVGQPCYLQVSAEQHRRTSWSYELGSRYRPERFHVGVRTEAIKHPDTAKEDKS